MNLQRNSGQSRGFTLIELMIVVAILGVLATAAVPSAMRYMFDAKEVEFTRGLLEAYRDQIRVRNDCDAGRYSNCAPGLKFTEFVHSGDSRYPDLLYRPPENGNFSIIAGNSDKNLFSVDAVAGAKFSFPKDTTDNFFGYMDSKSDGGHEHFMMGAEGLINGKKHVLGINETGTLFRICDAWSGQNGPGAAVYVNYFTVDPKCGDEPPPPPSCEGFGC